MLAQTPNNLKMIGKINATIAAIVKRFTPKEVPEESQQELVAAVKTEIADANEDADNLSGIKSVTWMCGGQQHTIVWTLKSGGIAHFAVKRDKPGLIRTTHEQLFFV